MMLCLYYWGITVGKSVVLHTLVKICCCCGSWLFRVV